MEDQEVKLHYDDICIVPEIITNIYSRKECDPYIDGMLPIFASPMGSVIDLNNYKTFIDNKINVVIPRTIPLDNRLFLLTHKDNKYNPFIAFSMDEVRNKIFSIRKTDLDAYNITMKICIDLANGHMNSLIHLIKDLKNVYKDRVVVMSGNIANPDTYAEYDLAGCDYVRVSIGTGSACLTASNTGVYYPPFSLLKDMYEIKKRMCGNCKIVADGGIKVYRDIQKALIYADYVMIGGVFNKCIESAGETTYGKSYFTIFNHKFRNYFVDLFRYGKKIDPSDYEKNMELVKKGVLEINKQFYGMSTKLAQVQTGVADETHKLKTSEGIIKTNKVEYSLSQWVENETDYLKSAMSYTNSIDLFSYKDSLWVRENTITHNK